MTPFEIAVTILMVPSALFGALLSLLLLAALICGGGRHD